MKKILLVGSQHGHELLGDKLIAYIREYMPELEKHAEFYLANPKAHAAKKRFIEEDMNRSYKSTKNTYESRQAKRLVEHIQTGKYDLVLDLHTTNADMQTSFIVSPKISETMRDFMHASEIETVVVMEHDSMNRSLAGAIAHCVAIEAFTKHITKRFLRGLAQTIEVFIHNSIAPTDVKKHIYYVTDYILKADYTKEQVESMKNFTYFDNSFYPVLVGSRSYKKDKPYVGFAAKIHEYEAVIASV